MQTTTTMTQHSSDMISDDRRKTFPFALHGLLQTAAEDNYEDVVSWTPRGDAFKVHRRDAFVSTVLPQHFRTNKYKSFSRQLNLWGFIRNDLDPMRGSYSHPSFRRDNQVGCRHICRQKKQTTKINALPDHDSPLSAPPASNMKSNAVGHTSTPTASDAPRDMPSALSASSDQTNVMYSANALITADIMSFMACDPAVATVTNSGDHFEDPLGRPFTSEATCAMSFSGNRFYPLSVSDTESIDQGSSIGSAFSFLQCIFDEE